VGLFAGLAALSPPRPDDHRGWWRRVYLLSLVILLGSLLVMVAVDWSGLDIASRVAFSALTALGAVMGVRIALAHRLASSRGPNWQERYIGHVYFTYISLWEGFVVLPALNLPLPQVTVPVVAILVLVIGHTLIARYKRRVIGVEPSTPA
jgi:cobalamin synthase